MCTYTLCVETNPKFLTRTSDPGEDSETPVSDFFPVLF